MADIIQQLEETRADYEKERRWHKLLLDAYSGGGGFQGAIQQPTSSYWGPASAIYGNAYYGTSRTVKSDYYSYNITAGESYLDQLPREDFEKFKARGDMSYYPNHIQGITDLKLAFLHSKPFHVEGRPDALTLWRQNVNGKGRAYEQVKQEIDRKAAILGWVPVLFDMPSSPVLADGTKALLTKAQAGELGIEPRMIPLLPSNLTDWQISPDGSFEWVKIRTDYMERESPFSDGYCVHRYTIWYPDRFQIYEVVDDKGQKRLVSPTPIESSHDFGQIPIVIQHYQKCPDDPIRGTPMHGQESLANRSLYSRTSELDEHMMKQQAAALVFATDNPEQLGELTVGAENGLTIPLNAGQQHYYLAPPSSVSEVYRARNADLVTEIYRMAGVEFLLTSNVPLSGISRRYQFMQLNADLVSYANNSASFDKNADVMVGRMKGIGEDILSEIKVQAPSNYDVEDLAEQIMNARDMLGLGLGPTADRAIKMGVVDSGVKNLTDEDKKSVQDELLQEAENQEHDATLEEEMNQEAPQAEA